MLYKKEKEIHENILYAANLNKDRFPENNSLETQAVNGWT